MELKLVFASATASPATRINRSFVELKRREPRGGGLGAQGINRSFVELKLVAGVFCSLAIDCINRSFVELKPVSPVATSYPSQVSIAPSWS